jgi:superfamily I DNA and/or RNA helicase
MILNELKHLTDDNIIELELTGEEIGRLTLCDDISIHQVEDSFFVKQIDQFYSVTNINDLLRFGDASNVLWVPISIRGTKLVVQHISCLRSSIPFSHIEVAIDDKIVNAVAKYAKYTNPSVEDVSGWLEEQFLLDYLGTQYLLAATYQNNQSHNELIVLVGREFRVQLEFLQDGSMWVKELISLSRNRDFDLSLIEAKLTFVDSTLVKKINDPLIQEKFDELKKNNSAYIKLWDEYNNRVKDKSISLAKRAKFVRYIKYEICESIDNIIEWHFYYQEKDRKAVDCLCSVLKEDKGQRLEISALLPDWLLNDPEGNVLISGERVKAIQVKLVKKTKQYLALSIDTNDKPPKPAKIGFIHLSISGSMVQMQRREKARDAITAMTNPMPSLRCLIENVDLYTGRTGYKTLKPLTTTAKRAFKGAPTEKQVEALNVALNTPDIALILGPPGTGKTQIISALQNRLSEEFEGKRSAEILLTSYQNDAVDNVVVRSEALGLPAIRADDKVRSPLLLEQWSKKQSAKLTKKIDEISTINASYLILKNVRQDIAALLDERLERNFRQVRFDSLLQDLDILRQKYGFIIPIELEDKLKKNLQSLEDEIKSDKNESLLIKVRALRTTLIAFEDDGMEQIWRCSADLKRLNKFKDSEEVAFLVALSHSFDSVTEKQLKELNQIKKRLIDQLIPDYRPKELKTVIAQASITALHELNNKLTDYSENCSAAIPDVIQEYLDTIKYQPDLLAESVRKYTMSIGATCQRSASERVVDYKNSINDVSDNFNFDTVIVDEAARANPLDLFIPMSLAKRRIVLVGDHFQLPQMLEPDLEKDMLDSGELNEKTADAIRKSLFERLYKQLKEREATDGIQRTVMLDTQFRMHPKIGKFISSSFYECEGEPVIKAGLDESHFNLGLAEYNGKVAQWIDLPLSEGKERRVGTSWCRDIEANIIANKIKNILDQNLDVSMGVITFFASQRELIFEKLVLKEICKKTENGWEYMPKFKTLSDGTERIRIGSVDAFQGKEFDVVLLSTVRSNNFPISDENSLRKKYGFIRTPNRLNVAFSRAKSLIIVIGDKAMFSGSDAAKSAVPQIGAFISDLCEG